MRLLSQIIVGEEWKCCDWKRVMQLKGKYRFTAEII